MKTKKRRNIFKSIVLGVCACFIAVFSVFSLVNTQDKIEVSADTITDSYTFTGSNYMTPHRAVRSGTYLNSLSAFVVSFSATNNILNSISLGYSSYSLYSYENLIISTVYLDFNRLDANYTVTGNFQIPIVCVPSNINNGVITMGKPIRVNFNHYYPTWDNTLCVNTVTYYDEFSNSLQFNFYFDVTAFPNGSNNNQLKDYIFWQSRTYYFNSDLSDSEQYNLGYNYGETQGFNSGYSQGYDEGESLGYVAGKNDGYWLGYEEGLSTEYSFTSLITAVVDVPVNTFRSLFNFELLGVNLSGFFLGLLTCCIVITVVRMII